MKLKYRIIFFAALFLTNAISNGYANTIDSLTGKEDVLRFLSAHFSATEMVVISGSPELSRTQKIKLFLSQPDSNMVEDPATGEMTWSIRPRDSSYLSETDTHIRTFDWLSDTITKRISERKDFRFDKADIDGNGLTDMVIDVGLIATIMDMDGKFEGHMLTLGEGLHFHSFIPLSYKTRGMIFKHAHNISCESGEIKECNKTDTVVYRHGFAKYNHSGSSLGITKLYYQHISSKGMLSDGYDCIEIDKFGKSFLKYSKYSPTLSGLVAGKALDHLWDLAGYVDIRSKRDLYYESVDHGEGSLFIVYFEDGTTKAIHAWEAELPLGLNYIYKQIADISETVNWQMMEGYDFKYPDIPPSTTYDCDCLW